jgi:hypothetical protein
MSKFPDTYKEIISLYSKSELPSDVSNFLDKILLNVLLIRQFTIQEIDDLIKDRTENIKES